jgi:Flp pilus assembly protein TadD
VVGAQSAGKNPSLACGSISASKIQTISLPISKLGSTASTRPWREMSTPPEDIRVALEAAVALHRAGKLDEAERKYRGILAADPKQPDAMSLLGQIVHQQGDTGEARALMERARSLRPDSPTITFNLGRLYFEQRDWKSAAAMNQEAARLAPTNAAPLCNLGIALCHLGCAVEGEAALRKSLALAADNALSWSGLGLALARQNRREEARQAFEKALVLNPDLAEAQFNLAEIFLGDMDFVRGWPLFRARAAADPTSFATGGVMPAGVPLWRGEDLTGKSVLIWGEQGLGDQVLFASLIPEILRRTDRVTIACDRRLLTVFARAFPGVPVISQDDDARHMFDTRTFDLVAPAGSLGHYFRPDRAAFAAQTPFLVAESWHEEMLRARYKELSGDLPVIGVAWRSSRADIGAAKSLPIPHLAKVLKGVRATYVSLQYGDLSEDIAEAAKLGLAIHADSRIDANGDLAGQADQIAAMDLVVSVSNTAVHLAGGLGKSVWTLAPLGAGRMWYWFAPVDTWAPSLWYPSMRVFHQRAPGDWCPVLERVRNDLISSFGA